MPEMWEHKCVHIYDLVGRIHPTYDAEKITAAMVGLGADGWQLVQVIKDDTLFLFKRKVTGEKVARAA